MPSLLQRSTLVVAVFGTLLLPLSPSHAQAPAQKSSKTGLLDRALGIKQNRNGGWLFAGFKDNGDSGVYFAISKDGYKWKMVKDGAPMLQPQKRHELMRDPFIQRDPDGSLRMVWTWGWGAPAVIGYSTSPDLVHWSAHRQLPVTAAIPTALNAWAPALYYDGDKKDWLILWSSAVPPPGSKSSTLDHRIYATTTTDFKHFTPAKLFFDPGYNVIDAAEFKAADQYILLFKDERSDPLEKHILTAKGDSMEGPWHDVSAPFTETWSEGPALIPVVGGYLVYYDHYKDPQHYGAAFSTDLQHWVDATGSVNLPAGMRHGSFLPLDIGEYNLLQDYHGNLDTGVTR